MNFLITFNSFKNFLFINSFLCSISVIQYKFLSYKSKYYIINFFLTLMIFLMRNYLIMKFINKGVLNKAFINNDDSLIPKEEFKYEFHYYVFSSTIIETITKLFIHNNFIFIQRNFYHDAILFIPISFLFEIIFDFFHYISHRLLHTKYLYKYCHKIHHKFKHPITITSYYQDPLDLIITNSIPTILTLLLINNISYEQFNMILIYKTFIEISGHCGKYIYPTSSFHQCIWLPKLLEIELYTEDHDLHHSLNNCNFSKRFSLWDKLFNTYTSSVKKY